MVPAILGLGTVAWSTKENVQDADARVERMNTAMADVRSEVQENAAVAKHERDSLFRALRALDQKVTVGNWIACKQINFEDSLCPRQRPTP